MEIKQPKLYKKDAKGNMVEWEVYVIRNDDGSATLGSRYGRVGGSIQDHSIEITEGKNIGRSNETTPWEQAEKEALSQWQHRLDRRGYSRDGERREQSGVMLAVDYHDLAERKMGVNLPDYFWVDPKLDGVRGKFLDNDRGDFVSRRELPYRAIPSRITNFLKGRGQFDGEFYIHGVPLRLLNGAVNKIRPGITENLQYHIFDIPEAVTPMEERKMKLIEAMDWEEAEANGVILVPSERIKREDLEAKKAHWERLRYEGVMIRLEGFEYLFHNKRSYGLIKWKEFIDAEFLCVDIAIDKDGGALLVIQLPNGRTMPVAIKGSFEYKQWVANHPEEVIGVMHTVRYQTVLDSGDLQFARVISARDYE